MDAHRSLRARQTRRSRETVCCAMIIYIIPLALVSGKRVYGREERSSKAHLVPQRAARGCRALCGPTRTGGSAIATPCRVSLTTGLRDCRLQVPHSPIIAKPIPQSPNSPKKPLTVKEQMCYNRDRGQTKLPIYQVAHLPICSFAALPIQRYPPRKKTCSG